MPFGYKENGEIDPLQSGVVKRIFDTMIKYCGEVTDKQLEDYLEEHKEIYGEDLDIAQTRDTLALEMTKRYIKEELDKTWQEYQSAKKGVKVSDSDE